MPVYIPWISVFPPSLNRDWCMRKISAAGFDGVEVLLTPWRKQRRIRCAAKKNHLAVRWHEIHSTEETLSDHHLNALASALWIVPKHISDRRCLIIDTLREPIVCYPDTWTMRMTLEQK